MLFQGHPDGLRWISPSTGTRFSFLSAFAVLAFLLNARPVIANEISDANAAYKQGDFRRAAELLESLANERNPSAQYLLYCQTDATVGTRFKTEKCYDEEQLRAYMLVLEAQRRDVDRIRTNCGGGPCTPYEPGMPR